ncbi:membrane protein US13 [Panine betaherpesvirus 2]|uniref:Membrane protein US13 n=1 Tax=Panine betaherpesvirus 2 TaxID=188763 RepID=Q8QRU6_9BETA|nr:membrane protein US13 [Panine betaherpesvirus 2]AAM00792.1 membrane protein US13 [Panine betaherpesvirus 2]QXV67910.1 membrane protein US13 [Panine betaherpesvirus 2]
MDALQRDWAELLRLHRTVMWLRRFGVHMRVYALAIFYVAATTAFCGAVWLGIPEAHNLCQKESSPMLLVFVPTLLWCFILLRGDRHPNSLVIAGCYVALLSVSTLIYTWCSELPAILTDYVLVITLWMACTGAVMTCDAFKARRWETICSRVLTSVFFITLWVIGDQTVFRHQRVILYGYGAILFIMMSVTFYGTRYIRDELPASDVVRGSLLIYVGLITMFKITLIVLSPNLWHLPWTNVFSSLRPHHATPSASSRVSSSI